MFPQAKTKISYSVWKTLNQNSLVFSGWFLNYHYKSLEIFLDFPFLGPLSSIMEFERTETWEISCGQAQAHWCWHVGPRKDAGRSTTRIRCTERSAGKVVRRKDLNWNIQLWWKCLKLAGDSLGDHRSYHKQLGQKCSPRTGFWDLC